jgi:hypothetical protein
MTNAPERGAHKEQTLSGAVMAVNFAPKGEIDGLLLDSGGRMIQVNIPPHEAQGAEETVGEQVEVIVATEPKLAEHPAGDHPVYKLVSFGGERGASEPNREHRHKPPKPKHAHDDEVDVNGTVHRLNYAKHGEANGVVLASGEFVHLRPDGMKKVALAVGQPVIAKGKSRAMPNGSRAIEASVVNGVTLGPKKPH